MKYDTVKLGDISWINTESYSSKENWICVNYLDTGNITENMVSEIQHIEIGKEKLPTRAKRKVKYNSIIYSTVRPNQKHYGIIKELPNNFLVSTGFAVIDIDTEKASSDYVYFVLTQESVTEYLHAIAEQSTSAYPSIKPSDLKNIEIRLPSLEDQKRIASILVTLNRKIDINMRINDNLMHQVSLIYQAWFEDFIPFGGVCPQTWKQGTLADIATIMSGKRPPMKSTEKTGSAFIPLVGATSVMGFTTESNHTDKILIIGRVGTHGIVQRFNSPCWASDNTLVITSDLYEYTYQILQRIDYHSMNRGSTQPLITQGDMNKVVILVPDQGVLKEFEIFAGQLMTQYESNLLESSKLAELRDTLLPKLMSGELDVSEIDF